MPSPPFQPSGPMYLQQPLDDKVKKEEILISRQSLRPSCYPLRPRGFRKRPVEEDFMEENEFKGNVMGMHMMVKPCKEVREIKSRWGRTLTHSQFNGISGRGDCSL